MKNVLEKHWFAIAMALPLVGVLLMGVILYASAAQRVVNIGTTVNDGTGDGMRTAFGKVNANFHDAFRPTRNGTNASHTLSTNVLIHAWTSKTVRGTNTLPPASVGSPTNVVYFIIKDEGGNASATNILYQVGAATDRIDSLTVTDFALGVDYQTVRIYSRGGTNWYYW